MKKRIFPLIVALSALSVAGSAAFYSVFGLSKLFAGAATQVIIMAGSLEFAKLVTASLLYQYWNTINKALKGYLMIAVFTLMIITSGGIYGFLSGAYQTTATQSELLDKSLVILQHKQTRFSETKEDLLLEKTQINQSISDLRISLSNPQQVSWFDKNSQTVITSTSSSARRALQAELKTTITERDNINLKLEAVLDSIGKTDMALLEKEISNEDQRELGPLKYLASTTGWPMDKVVNYFLLLIIFVFDPLAIALVVAANFAFAQINPKRKEEDYFISRNEHLEKIVEMKPPVGLREEDSITEAPEELKETVKEPTPVRPTEEELKKLENFLKELKSVEKEKIPQSPVEEEITLDGGEIEVTVQPSPEQMKELEEEYFEDLEELIVKSEKPVMDTEVKLDKKITLESLDNDLPLKVDTKLTQKERKVLKYKKRK